VWPWRSTRKQLDSQPATTFSATLKPLDDAVRAGWFGTTGYVARDAALSLPVIQRGRNVLASVATLPLRLYAPDGKIQRSALLEQIDPDVPNVVTLAQTVEDLLFEGIAWWRITAQDFAGFPVAARHLSAHTVSLTRPVGAVNPLPSATDPRGVDVIWINGVPTPVNMVIRFDSPNPPLLRSAARSIKTAVLLDQMSNLYAEDPRPLDYFTAAANAEIDDADVEAFLSRWVAARKRRATAYVPETVEYHEVSTPTPQQLQLVELKREAALDLANALGIDPEDVGVSTTSRTYFNAQDRRTSKINETFAPYMSAITGRLSMGDVTRRGYAVKFDLTDYLKPDPVTQATYWRSLMDMGVMDATEVRAAAGLSGPPPAPMAPVNPGPAVPAAHATQAGHTFAGPALTLTLDAPTVQFSVDAERRTITGLALPYGQVARKGDMSYRFQPGSLQWSDLGRVKHFQDHVTPMGRALDLQDTEKGLLAKLSVARGADGDRLLALAEDGVYDGLSVGVDFTENDVVLGKDGVYDVHRADLREVSTTAMPAFDDARVTKVAASRTEGKPMTQPDTATPAPAPAGAQFDMGAFVNALQQAVAAPVERPTTVNPTRLTAAVTEATPYRFTRNGTLSRGSHEFSADLFAASRGDVGANDRVLEFTRAQFDVISTDVNELNPNRQRPDMYVDQRSFQYPVWDAINKGTLQDITPFTFPKFSSASGLVAAHTEGSEPSSGTLVTTSQTVTPTALSGKAKVSRETWDQGGNPQISNLIWRQMVKGWNEALEAAAVAVLDAATPTAIDFSATPGLSDDLLDQALTQAFASLQFVRGGFSMNKMFTQIDLYKALIGAVDSNGRRLYPALGPTNAAGTVSSRYASLDINGVTALPAWALAATGTVSASSYLFDSDTVHGWASAPQRLDFNIEVANVYIGIWGYKATAISDTNGVREIIYDPS
jgi:HK97 family phage prohead protease